MRSAQSETPFDTQPTGARDDCDAVRLLYHRRSSLLRFFSMYVPSYMAMDFAVISAIPV